ncbi:hypothetical protein [Salmonirosea aquatica]|uniref:Uncharacterized protein n=1 Tax=Salmonirosea aquatica TaxID=2654236 RepID=A0A7C9BG49_9BACT|nr:hypothetical protein [Cytophagaceae bacterium SJW1-29]
MNRLFILLFAVALNQSARAQTEGPNVTVDSPVHRNQHHIPEDASVMMADGKSRKVSEVAPGDPVKCIKAGVVATTHIRQVNHLKRSRRWLTALYLRPVEKKNVNRTVWPMVPAVLLEAAPTLSVTTHSGTKTISQLRKGDVLYRYEPATQQVSAWEVGIVKRKSRRAESLYALVTENGAFLFENMVAIEQ